MKTLDEVIKKYEMCSSQITCSTCPYYQEICSCDPDALHYLKEFKRYQNTPSRNGHMALVDYFEESQKNEPLTWDELKTMMGKPIWVKYEGYAPDWEVIEYIGDTKLKWGEVIETHLSILHKENQGKEWQAYRKETI